jgi:hypothetical protein
MELQEFYEYMEQHRANAVDAAVQRYHSLTPLLGKVGGSCLLRHGRHVHSIALPVTCILPLKHTLSLTAARKHLCNLLRHCGCCICADRPCLLLAGGGAGGWVQHRQGPSAV